MEFLYRDEAQPDGSNRRVLYPNKTHAPAGGKDCQTIEVPTDKPGLQSALQELFDMIDWTGTKVVIDAATLAPAVDASRIAELNHATNTTTLPNEGELSTKDQLALRLLLSNHWNELPLTFKADLTCLALEDIRPHLDDLKAKAIGL